MRKMIFAVAVSVLAMATSPVWAAEANYSPDDVINSLLKTANVGETRGICVGTAAECSQSAKPAGFDVMVNFDLASATLTPDALENLRQVAAALTDPRLGAAKFAIDGYTDARGTEAYNQTLSALRAKAVADFLIGQGISADRLVAAGLGEAAPRTDDPFDPVNRRVEMRIKLN